MQSKQAVNRISLASAQRPSSDCAASEYGTEQHPWLDPVLWRLRQDVEFVSASGGGFKAQSEL